MAAEMQKHEKCVISGSLCGWGDIFIPRTDYYGAIARIKTERDFVSREAQPCRQGYWYGGFKNDPKKALSLLDENANDKHVYLGTQYIYSN